MSSIDADIVVAMIASEVASASRLLSEIVAKHPDAERHPLTRIARQCLWTLTSLENALRASDLLSASLLLRYQYEALMTFNWIVETDENREFERRHLSVERDAITSLIREVRNQMRARDALLSPDTSEEMGELGRELQRKQKENEEQLAIHTDARERLDKAHPQLASTGHGMAIPKYDRLARYSWFSDDEFRSKAIHHLFYNGLSAVSHPAFPFRLEDDSPTDVFGSTPRAHAVRMGVSASIELQQKLFRRVRRIAGLPDEPSGT